MVQNILFFKASPKFIIVVLLLSLKPFGSWSQNIQQDTANLNLDTTGKVDIIDVIKSNFNFKEKKLKRSPGKKVYFSLLPVSLPRGGRALITSTSAGFYLGNRRNTYLSNVVFSPYLNFKGRYSIAFRSNLYTNYNKWNIIGDTRFSLYPEYIYGSRNSGYEDDKVLVNYKYIRFYQTLLRRIRPYFLAGMGYNLDYHININTINDTIGLQKFTGYDHGTGTNQNSVSSGITFNLLYDTRNNSINPLPGMYANFIYRTNPHILGNGSNTWKSLYLDVRKYISFPDRKRKVLALWSYMWTALNNNVPYFDLPGIGWDPYQRSGRGIEQNRYRGKSMWYVEGEYRRDITMNGLLGYVLFTNYNFITDPANRHIRGPYPAIGGGLRIKFNKRSDTNIAIDYGLSKGYSSIYLNLGEVF